MTEVSSSKVVATSPSGRRKKEVPPPPDVNLAHAQMIAQLYSKANPNAENLLKSLEQNTLLPRETLLYLFIGLNCFYLIVGYLASTLCNFIGFAYPAYVSVKAIRTTQKNDDTKWLIYWTVFGFLSIIDTFTDAILHFFPFYYLFKAVFLLFLYLPQTNGAEYIYLKYVDPFVTWLDDWWAGRLLPAGTPQAAKEAEATIAAAGKSANPNEAAPATSPGAAATTSKRGETSKKEEGAAPASARTNEVVGETMKAKSR